MAKFVVDNIEIEFPFEPYEEQKLYMRKVIECLSQRKIGVLESPTGTGKTLSLLCATLSWFDKNRHEAGIFSDPNPSDESQSSKEFSFLNRRNLFPRIIYASRTHSQLSKAMTELQKTSFRNFNITILGSRDQMCIHPQVMKEPNLSLKNALCSMHMKAKSCHFGNNVEKAMKDDNILPEGIIDLEDLITKSKKINCCPYYLARELQAKADVIFMPYNYLFDYHIRKVLNISLSNAIVILDEAHNIDKVCEEASSVVIKSSDIALAITEVTKEMQAIYDDTQSGYFLAEREYSTEELCFVKERLTAFEKLIDEFPVSKDNSITKSGVFIFELLQKADIDYNSAAELSRLLSVISEYLSSATDVTNRGGGSLKKFSDDLDIIFSSIKNTNVLLADNDFRVHIEEETFKNLLTGNKSTFKKDAKPGKVVNYWCFNPGYSLGNTVKEDVRCVILTSGTLAPISSYVKEMALKDPVIVECKHIVSEDQVLVIKLECGPRKVPLKCTFANRQNTDYWQELGLTLQNYFRIIPDGVLIFFPGYATLNTALKMWRELGLWDKLVSIKPIYIEPQNKSELQLICSEYYGAIDSGNGRGAVFIGVCRGKISEGLDFSDKYGRAVIVAGLPYPPLFDPKVKLKKQYIDRNKKSPDDLNGDTWYLLEATKAVNQAIGRVIRHNKDYGAIILCDAQFNTPKIVGNLSKWVQEKLVKAKNFGDSIGILRTFFKKNNSSMPSPVKYSQCSQLLSSQTPFSNVNNLEKRSDIKCLEAYWSRLSSNTQNAPQAGPSSVPSSSHLQSGLTIMNKSSSFSLTKQIKIVSNLISYYEKSTNLNPGPQTPSSKSCLESIDAEDRSSFQKTDISCNLFNTDSLKDKNLLTLINKLLEEFEVKKKSLPSPPSSVFEVGDDTSEEDEASNLREDNNFISLDCPLGKNVASLISRLHRLNKYLADNSKKNTSASSGLDVFFGGNVVPAKRRKIKLESIQIEDIQLPGNDEKTRAREKRLNDTKNFLLELKTLLEPSSYYSLVNLIKKFNSKDDFQNTIKYLQELFPIEDEESRGIFKRCYLLFTGEWEKVFVNYCECNSI